MSGPADGNVVEPEAAAPPEEPREDPAGHGPGLLPRFFARFRRRKDEGPPDEVHEMLGALDRELVEAEPGPVLLPYRSMVEFHRRCVEGLLAEGRHPDPRAVEFALELEALALAAEAPRYAVQLASELDRATRPPVLQPAEPVAVAPGNGHAHEADNALIVEMLQSEQRRRRRRR